MHLQHFGQQDHDGVLVYIGREIPNTHAIRFCCSFGGKRQWCKTVLALRMDFAAYQMPFRRVFQWQQPKRCCVWTGKPKRGNNIRVKGAPVTQMGHLVQFFLTMLLDGLALISKVHHNFGLRQRGRHMPDRQQPDCCRPAPQLD